MRVQGSLKLRTVEGSGLLFDGRTGEIACSLDSGAGAIHPSPVQAVLLAIGSCSAMDVIGILRKQRQAVTGYEVLLSAERAETHPRVFTRVEVLHRLTGHGLRRGAVEEAIRLSDTKYCSVQAMLRPSVEIVSRCELIEAPESAAPAP